MGIVDFLVHWYQAYEVKFYESLTAIPQWLAACILLIAFPMFHMVMGCLIFGIADLEGALGDDEHSAGPDSVVCDLEPPSASGDTRGSR